MRNTWSKICVAMVINQKPSILTIYNPPKKARANIKWVCWLLVFFSSLLTLVLFGSKCTSLYNSFAVLLCVVFTTINFIEILMINRLPILLLLFVNVTTMGRKWEHRAMFTYQIKIIGFDEWRVSVICSATGLLVKGTKIALILQYCL